MCVCACVCAHARLGVREGRGGGDFSKMKTGTPIIHRWKAADSVIDRGKHYP